MKLRAFSLLIILSLLLVSCNLRRAASTTTLTPIEANQGTPVGVTPSPSPSPTHLTPLVATPFVGTVPGTPSFPANTLAPTLTLTPSAAMVTPKTEAVNCRFGPGTSYLAVGGLQTGVSVPILGQSSDGTWWQIKNPNNVFTDCWVSSIATNTTGSAAAVPIVPPPASQVTLVTVNSPAAISVPGCIGPIQPIVFTGTIDVNGPATVTYHFETEQGGVLPAHNLVFTKFGPFNVSDNSYTPPLTAGTYWVKLFVTAPNSLTAQANYTISCP